MKKYYLEFAFKGKPECERCMVGMVKMGTDGETVKVCAALSRRPKCPEEGCRKDCPLLPI